MLGNLRTPQILAELSADAAIVELLLGDLSGEDLADVSKLLARGRVGDMSVDIAAIVADPGKHSFGDVAAAQARDFLLEHQENVTRTGTGTIQGNQCANPLPVGARSADCTTYVLDVLKGAFAAKNQSSVWTKVMSTAAAASPPRKLLGTEVLKALQTEAGWEGIFWAPDPRRPRDKSPEHSDAYKKVREKERIMESPSTARGLSSSIAVRTQPTPSTYRGSRGFAACSLAC